MRKLLVILNALARDKHLGVSPVLNTVAARIPRLPEPRTAPMPLYFAYGSNMSSRRLRARVPAASLFAPARLAGYRLAFVRGEVNDGSGKCNICPATREAALVHGVLWQVDRDGKALLDRIEGTGFGYVASMVTVACEQGPLPAFTYIATACEAAHAHPPYGWYLDYVLAGAREHDLPWSYAAALCAQPVIADGDAARARRERALLAGIALDS